MKKKKKKKRSRERPTTSRPTNAHGPSTASSKSADRTSGSNCDYHSGRTCKHFRVSQVCFYLERRRELGILCEERGMLGRERLTLQSGSPQKRTTPYFYKWGNEKFAAAITIKKTSSFLIWTEVEVARLCGRAAFSLAGFFPVFFLSSPLLVV